MEYNMQLRGSKFVPNGIFKLCENFFRKLVKNGQIFNLKPPFESWYQNKQIYPPRGKFRLASNEKLIINFMEPNNNSNKTSNVYRAGTGSIAHKSHCVKVVIKLSKKILCCPQNDNGVVQWTLCFTRGRS